MEPLKTLSGGAFVHQTFEVEDAFPDAGVPAMLGAAADAGIQIGTTVSAANALGLSVDTALANNANLVTVIINPDLVIRCKQSGSATEDTALTIGLAGASSTNLVIDNITAAAGGAFSTAGFADCSFWGYDGVNQGEVRSASTADANTLTALNAFTSAFVDGVDTFLVACRSPGILSGLTLSTLVTQNDSATEAVGAAEFVVLDGEFNDVSNDGINNSFIHIIATDHAFTSGA